MLSVYLLLVLGLLANLGLLFLGGVVCSSPGGASLFALLFVVGPLYSLLYHLPSQMRLYLSYIPFFGVDSGLLAGEVLGSVWATSADHRYSCGYFACLLGGE